LIDIHIDGLTFKSEVILILHNDPLGGKCREQRTFGSCWW